MGGLKQTMSKEFIENMKLVKTAIRQIDTRKLPAMIDRNDLEQEGYIELQRCLKRFKDDGRAKFSTYADKCIRRRIMSKLIDAHWGPKHAGYHRRKQQGKELIKDMVSYDSFSPVTNDDDHESWVDNLSERDSVWDLFASCLTDRKRDDKTKSKLIKSVESLLKKKPSSNNTSGFSGVVHRPKSEYRNKWSFSYKISLYRIKVDGFADAASAYIARQESLVQLKKKLLGID